jgi:quercetin dioxygenase-like cupin family protein
MSQPLIRRGEEIEATSVGAADGVTKSVLVGEEQGAPNVAIREFTIAPGGSIPKHTNDIEHEQYVLRGEYVVGIEQGGTDEEYTVTAGDAIHVPAGAVHWYRNEGEEPGVFVCAVPTGDDSITLVDAE